jgi:hypothetical protein
MQPFLTTPWSHLNAVAKVCSAEKSLRDIQKMKKPTISIRINVKFIVN